MMRAWLFAATALSPIAALAQPTDPPPVEPTPPDGNGNGNGGNGNGNGKPWYDKLSIRGYAQLRFNRLHDTTTEKEFRNDLGDRNIAEDNSFSIRRARLIVQGDVAPYLFMYLQTEAAGADVKMRDWYGDVAVDPDKELRFRIGQSKVPYGWENMQSSQNRLPLDRSDPINSAAPGERDLGVFAYWAPEKIRKLFRYLVDGGLKGSGDYGVVGFGVYNGQTLNIDDRDGKVHVVARVAYPFELGGQILELNVAGYHGTFTVDKDEDVLGGEAVRDVRVAGTAVLYPRPIGLQAEWNIGKGPELVGDTIQAETLHGGYAMAFVRVKTCWGEILPFVRGAYYEGGIKTIRNAPLHRSKELIVGGELQIKKHVELVVEMDHAKREVGSNAFWGTLFRTQLQLNY
jgi:hypothetical protein